MWVTGKYLRNFCISIATGVGHELGVVPWGVLLSHTGVIGTLLWGQSFDVAMALPFPSNVGLASFGAVFLSNLVRSVQLQPSIHPAVLGEGSLLGYLGRVCFVDQGRLRGRGLVLVWGLVRQSRLLCETFSMAWCGAWCLYWCLVLLLSLLFLLFTLTMMAMHVLYMRKA